VDNALDTGSGTIRARAEVANPTGFLTPGMFGHMRLLGAHTYQALLIPDVAVVTDQARQVAYVVGPDGTVGQRVVEVGRLVNGLRVVRSGLTPTDRVIVSGVQRARPGRKVKVKPGVVTAFPSGISTGETSRLVLPPGGAR
jgi:RND family efflux transporter MFP subunit